MWRRLLNSAVLVAVTHRRLGRMSDGTSTQVVAYKINKWKAKISQKKLYNVRDPLGMGGEVHLRICRKNTIAQRIEILIKSKKNIFKNYSPRALPRKYFFA